MTQWSQAPTGIKAPPQTDDIKVIRDYVDMLAGIVALISKDLEFIINGNLDVKNIRARSITADRLKVGTITAEEIAANTITADKMNVNELSAISADLGHITAGLIEAVTIIGSLIKTAATGQRIELSSTENLLMAVDSLGATLKLYANYSASAPSLVFTDAAGNDQAWILKASTSLSFNSDLSTDINITSSRDLILSSGPGRKTLVQSWSKLTNGLTTLQQELDNLQSQINGKANTFGGFTGTFFVSSTLGGANDQEVTVTNGIITNVV